MRARRLLRRIPREWFLTGMAVFVIFAATSLILSSLRLHTEEFTWQLRKAELLEGGVSQTHLVAKFMEIRNQMAESSPQHVRDARELQLYHALAGRRSQNWKAASGHDIVDGINVHIIDKMREAMDKPPLPSPLAIGAMRQIEKAIQLELGKQYEAALAVYEKIDISGMREPRMEGLIALHKGFCLAVLGKQESAIAQLEAVVVSQRGNDLSISATTLLEYMRQLQTSRSEVMKSNMAGLGKAQQLSRMLNCKDAEAILDTLQLSTQEQKAEVELVRGRCQEERGNSKSAAQHYLTAVKEAGNSDLARDANRRLYVMGTTQAEAKPLQAVAQMLNNSLADSGIKELAQLEPNEPLPAPVVDTPDATLAASIPIPLTPTAVPLAPTVAPQAIPAPSSLWAEVQAQATQVMASVQPRVIAKVEPLPPPQPEPASEPTKEKKKAWSLANLPPVGSTVHFQTKGGRSFVGILVSQPPEPVLRIKSLIGIIGIPKNQIASLTSGG